MKVAHVIKAKGIAGTERHLLILLPALRARGIDARLILLEPPDNRQDELTAEMEAHGVPVTRMLIHSHADVGAIRRIGAALDADRPQIVHTHLIHADLYGTIAARQRGLPVIISAHADGPERTGTLMRPLFGWVWRTVDQGIAISDAVARFLPQEGAAPNKITTVHYGMEPLPFDANVRAELRSPIAAPPDTVIVGIASRLIAPKGITYGLKAFARAADPFPNAQLVIIGDGDARAELEAEANALNLAHRAHFIGWQPDAARLMAGFDIFLMPSLREGFGLALLEAMAARLPIVASGISAIPEVVIDGATGYLAPARDVATLVEHLSLLLGDADLRARMGAAGEARLREHFSVERMTTRTLAVYDQVVAAH